MADISVANCACPQCNGRGRKLAAMHYAETKVWDKTGRFSGAGVGVGTGGIGIGIGGGTYTERGQIASKRAATFAEPVAYLKPVGGCIAAALILAAIYSSMPGLIDTFLGEAPSHQASTLAEMVPMREAPPEVTQPGTVMPEKPDTPAQSTSIAANMSATVDGMLAYLLPLFVIAILIQGVMLAKRNQRHNDKVLTVDHPKLLARYNRLYYCGSCHILYDDTTVVASADSAGFNRLLSIRTDT